MPQLKESNSLSYWFAIRVFDKKIDLKLGVPVLEGPFELYDEAESKKRYYVGTDIQKTPIFQAASKEDAEKHVEEETWVIF